MDDLSKDELLFLKAKGNVSKRLRIGKGYEENQETFASDHGFSRSHYQLIEAGKNMTDISNRRYLTHHELKLSDFYLLVEQEYEKLKNNPNTLTNLKAI